MIKQIHDYLIALGAAGDTEAYPRQITHVVHRTNPRFKEEAVMLQTSHKVAGSSSEFISLFIRNDKSFTGLVSGYGTPGTWTLVQMITGYQRGGVATADEARVFDLAYETKSGRLLVVYGELKTPITIGPFAVGSNQYHEPHYMVWNYSKSGGPGFDTTDGLVYSTGPAAGGSDYVGWIKLNPHPAKDDILLTWACFDGGHLFSTKWTSGGFQSGGLSPGKITDNLSKGWPASGATYFVLRPFDVAIESSGRAVLAFGENATPDGTDPSTLRYRTIRLGKDATDTNTDVGWRAESYLNRILDTTTSRLTKNGPSFVALAAEPGGNRIAAGIYVADNTNGNRVYAATWDGTCLSTASDTGSASPNCWMAGVDPSASAPGGTVVTVNGSTPIDIALVDPSPRVAEARGTFPVAVSWVGSTQTWGLFVYSKASSNGIDWAMFAPVNPSSGTAYAKNKWVVQTPAPLNTLEEVGFLMETLPDHQRVMLLASQYDSGTKEQRLQAGTLTLGSVPVWGTFSEIGSHLGYYTASDAISHFTPFGFGINLGFPRFYSGSGVSNPPTQYLGVGAGPTKAQPIHVEDVAGLITSKSGIRVYIPGDMKMEWGVSPCPATTNVKVSGTAISKLSTKPDNGPAGAALAPGATVVPVCALTDGVTGDTQLRLLEVGVFTDFSPGDTVVLESLDATNPLLLQGGRNVSGPLPFSVVSSLDKLGLDITADGIVDVTDEAGIQIAERLEIGNAIAGQVTNAFVPPNLPTATNQPLLTFQLTPRGGDVLLHSLQFDLTNITGPLTTADISSPTLTSAISISTVAGPPPYLIASFNNGSSDLLLKKDISTSFTLKATVSSLASPDGMQINLTPGQAPTRIVANASGGTGTTNLDGNGLVVITTFTPKKHKVAKYDPVTTTAAVLAGDPLTISWDSTTNTYNPAFYSYSTTGSSGPWTDFTGTGTCSGAAVGSCQSTAPTANATTMGFVTIKGNSVDPNDVLQAVTTTPFKVSEFLEASDPGQPANALNTTSAVTQANLLSVKLTARGAAVNVQRLKFTVTASAGLALSNYRLVKGGSTVAGPQATPDFTGLSGVSFNIAKDGNATYQLQADVDSAPSGNPLPPGGTVTATLTLATSAIVGQGSVTNDNPLTIKTIPAGLTQLSVTHTVSTYVVTPVVAPATQVIVSSPWTITWQSYGTASATNVKVEYKTHAIGWTDITSACTITAGQCTTTVPDQASTQAQVRVTDNTVSTITGTSTTFNIATVLSSLTLDGAGVWVVGRTQQVQWTQTGSSATTTVDLSLDNGSSYTIPITTQSVTGPFPVTKTVTFQPAASQATTTAKVRVQDSDSNHPTTKVESATFTIDFAYKNIQFFQPPTSASPSSTLTVGSQAKIQWSSLPAYASGNVVITAVGSNPGGLLSSQIANSGSLLWTPTTAVTGTKLQICSAVDTTVCATSAAFNVVAPAIQPLNSDYQVGQSVLIQWTGADSLSQVVLSFKANDGSPDVAIGTAAGASGAAGLTWTIPTTLAVKKTGTIHLVDGSVPANPAISADSNSITIHGTLSFTGPTDAPTAGVQWLIGTPQTITWDGKGQMNVKLEYSTDGGATYVGTPMTASTASVTGPNSFSWTPPITAKSATAVIRISDTSDPTVSIASQVFHIIGQLSVTQPVAGNYPFGSPTPITIQWVTNPSGLVVSPVRLRILDSTNAVVFQNPSVPSPGSPTTLTWTPTTTGKSLKAEICDVNDLTVCGLSASFNVSGISVTTDQSSYTMTAGGVPVTVQWHPVGLSGNFYAYYQVGGVLKNQIPDAATTFTSNDDVINTFTWTVPATFADLSNQLQIVVKDTSGTIQGASSIFTITGVLSFTGPSAGTYSVTDPVTISWNTIGQIPSVDLWWSTDNCATPATAQTRIPVASNTPNGPTAVANWPIPFAAVSSNLRFCVTDMTSGHAPTTAMSSPLAVGAKLQFQGLTNGDQWAVGTSHAISWTTVGSVGQVQIEYGVLDTNGNFVSKGLVNGGPLADSGTGTTTVNWTVSDLPSQMGDPQVNWTIPFKLRITDATASHPTVPAISAATLNAYYYHIEWILKDENGTTISDGASVVDSSGWTIQNDGWVPSLDPFDGQLQRFHFYKAGTYTTQVSKTNYQPGELDNWVADGNKTLTIVIISNVGATIPIHVNTASHYDPTTQQVTINSWLEQRGQLESNPVILGPGPATIEIYDGSTLLTTLSAATPDSAGQYAFTWDATGVVPGIYFARAKIERVGNPITSGGAFNIEVTGSGSGGSGTSGVTLTELQNELSPLKTDVSAVKGATVGPTSTLATQIQNTQTAIQTDVATVGGKVDAVQADTTALKLDTTALKATTSAIQTDTTAIKSATDTITTKVDDVKAYLADPTAGLPKVLQNQTNMSTQLKAQRKGKILNRATSLEAGDTVTIQYAPADPTAVPSIRIYGPGGFSVGPAPMAGPSGDGLFQFAQTFGAGLTLGEYTAVVSEPASTNSDGTVDSVALMLRSPTATAQSVTDVLTKLSDLGTQLSGVETSLNGQLSAIQSAMATKAQADTILTATDELKAKWGTLSAQDLQNQLAGLYTLIGVPKTGSLAGDIAAIPAPIDYSAQLTALQNSLDALRTTVGTPAQASALQTALDDLTTLKTQLTTLTTTVGDPAQKTVLDNVVTQLNTIQGSMATDASVQTALTQLNTIKTTMAKDANVQTALNQLTTLQTNLSTLTTQVGTPAQASALQAVADQVTALQQAINNLPAAKDYTAQLTALQNGLNTLSTTVGTPAQTAALQAVANQVTALQGAVAAVPKTDYTAQLSTLQTDLTTLTTKVNDPAQRAALQAVADQITTLQQQIVALPGATNYTPQLSALSSAIDALKQQITAIPTANYSSDLAALKASLSTLSTTSTSGSSGSTAATTTTTTTSSASTDTASILAKLNDLQKAINSAQGSSAAVGLSQGAYDAAKQALVILQDLQADLKAHGTSANGPALLGQFGDKISNVASSVTVIPGKLSTEELSEQLKKLAQQAKAVSSDKGYQFDSLFEMTQGQSSDVKTVRNQVEELKQLLELQRSILERNMNQPVVKTWFEAN